MAPAQECKTHHFVARTPRSDEATVAELQEMNQRFADHASRKGFDHSQAVEALVNNNQDHINEEALSDDRGCEVIYHEVTPSNL